MRQAALAACAVLGAACAGEVDPDGSLECPCGSESTSLAGPEFFDETLAEFTELISAEPLCPGSPYPGGSLLPESLAIPYADGELSPWCDRER